VQAESLRVTVVLSETGGFYLAFSKALRDKLQADRFVLNAARVDEAIGDTELYVAVGMKAATELAARGIPTLNVLVPKAGYDRLPRESAQRVTARSAIYLDQPMERQIDLLLAALPGTQHVGVLYTVPPPELANVRRLLADRNIRLHDHAVDERRSLNDALENVLNESEVLFVLPDSEVYNPGTIRNILLTAYRKQVPLLGISQAYVKAGALCAVFSTPEQVADQAAAMIGRYAESGKLPAPQYPAEFEVSVNMQVARSLDLHIKDAGILRDEIRRIP
jgi:ABC-type uncharacterized transport system substrate-binding protein